MLFRSERSSWNIRIGNDEERKNGDTFEFMKAFKKFKDAEHSPVCYIFINDFYNAIDRASLLTNESDKNTIMFESNKNEVLVSSNIPEIGNVKENITVENITGKNIQIAFSSKYMMEALKTFDASEIELCFNGDIKPIILKNKEDDSLIQLIVPIRTY